MKIWDSVYIYMATNIAVIINHDVWIKYVDTEDKHVVQILSGIHF